MIDLDGLHTGAAQTWGAVRLVPLLRAEPITDLRLHPRFYDPDDLSIVDIGRRTAYVGFIPHAFVASWTDDGTPAAVYGTQLHKADDALDLRCIRLQFRRRMARREDKQRLRLLPLHLALEGYLSLQFGGPSIAWEEWTRNAVTRGLSPRVESAYSGGAIAGLDDALRIFEIHPDQCGMALYVADALASVFVVPHPVDYRALHPTLLQDFFGDLIYQYACLYPAVPDFTATVDASRVDTVADLRDQLAIARADWAAFHAVMAGGLLNAVGAQTTPVYRMGRFTLSRFLPAFDPDTENHIGEMITDGLGRVAYLKTLRLSAAQTRRGHLLSLLARHDWNLDAAATALGTNRKDLTLRIDHAGFGHLLRPDIIDAFRHQARQATSRR